VVKQADAKALAREAFGGRKALFDRLSGVFDNAGIAKRHIAAPLDWYSHPHGWNDRNSVYLKAAEALFIEAATAAIEKASLTPDQIDGVVTVTTTGIATPSLEARAAAKVGFRDNVRRVPVFGLGCAGGVNGLALASRLAAAEPGSHWLFVTVETCSISIRLDSDDPAAIVATALFGDGAAAAVVTSGHHSLARITGSTEKLFPDTLRIMGWDVEDPGLAVVFDRAIPPFIDEHLAETVDEMCLGLWRQRIRRRRPHHTHGGDALAAADQQIVRRKRKPRVQQMDEQGLLRSHPGRCRMIQHLEVVDPVESGIAQHRGFAFFIAAGID